MPLVSVVGAGVEDADVAALLFKDAETLTIEGEVIESFLSDCDFSDVFEDAEVKESGLAKSAQTWGKADESGDVEEVDKGIEGASEYAVDTIEGVDLAEVVDLDDLAAMFSFYVENEMPGDTLEEKARLAVARELAGLDEAGPFKKGAFRKMHAQGGASQVNRMLGAMIAKGAIKRAKASGPGTPRKDGPGFTNQGGVKGAGYKGGDYQKAPPGYGGGTAPRIAIWQRYKKGKKTKLVAVSKKASVKKGAKIAAKFAKKVSAKKGAASKLAVGKKKATISASASPSDKPVLSEGAVLSSKMLGVMESSTLVKPITETTK